MNGLLHHLPRVPTALLALILLGALGLPLHVALRLLRAFVGQARSAARLRRRASARHGRHSGRDVLVRLMWGCRISLLVALVASFTSLSIGVTWGVTAGYLGGRIDTLMMRVVDVLYSVPFIPFVIVLTVLFGRNLLLLFIAIGAVSWLDIARIVRGQTLSLREREFVTAARVMGAGTAMLVRRHLVPNLFGIVIVYLTLTIPTVILIEAFLSFLGLGAQAPLTSLGMMIADGAAQMQARPVMLIFPAALLAAIVYLLQPHRRCTARRARWGIAMSVLAVHDLTVQLGEHRLVDGVSFSIEAGEVFGIAGSSGSGKTQLLYALMGLSPRGARLGGSAVLEGRELVGLPQPDLAALRGNRIGMVFQDPMNALNPYLSIGTQLTEVLEVHRSQSRRAARETAVAMLDAVHIVEPRRRLGQYPHELSGGMRQRVMIAMALLCEPAVLLADEPTTALDVTVQAQVLALLVELTARLRTAIVFVTHDLGVLASIADRVAVMAEGRIVEESSAVAMFASPQHAVTRGLLDAAREMALPVRPQ